MEERDWKICMGQIDALAHTGVLSWTCQHGALLTTTHESMRKLGLGVLCPDFETPRNHQESEAATCTRMV